MASSLERFLTRLKKRHPFLFLVIGGVLILVDNIGRAQVIKDIWSEIKITWTAAHLAWPNHLLTWIGFAIVAIGLLALLWPGTRSGTSVTSEALTSSPPNPTPPNPAPPTDEPLKSSPARVMLGPNLTPQYLGAQMDGRTAYQFEKLIEIYIGKWMRLGGPIVNIRASMIENIMVVSLDGGAPMNAGLRFDKSKWVDHLSILPVGETISVVGKISAVERYWIWLEECELEN
jgi:hypothetical protein